MVETILTDTLEISVKNCTVLAVTILAGWSGIIVCVQTSLSQLHLNYFVKIRVLLQ
jgi:hypothetical protein